MNDILKKRKKQTVCRHTWIITRWRQIPDREMSTSDHPLTQIYATEATCIECEATKELE